MRRYFEFFLLFCFSVVPVITWATTVTLEIDGQVGDTTIELGFPVGRVLSVRLSGTVGIIPAAGDCEAIGGGVACSDFSYQVNPSVFVSVVSNSVGTGIELLGSGAFDQVSPISDEDGNLLFSDGTGLLRVTLYMDPGSPVGCYGGALCTYMGSVISEASASFNGPIILTMEIEESVATVNEPWGYIKALYR